MEKMSGFMKKTLVNGLMKALFAVAVVTAVVSVSPKKAEAATPKMSSTKMTVTAGERFTLTVKNAGKKTINWTSSKTKVATVTKNGGNVVTKKKGTATITATVGNKEVKCKVTVKAPAAKPYLTTTSKTLRVGESFLLIEGQCTDYQTTFSFNDTIATIDGAGRVVGTGIGTTRVFVTRNNVKYYCTIKVVAGKAPVCKHQWMDILKYNSKGVVTGDAFIIKVYNTQGYSECNGCHEKTIDPDETYKHKVTTTDHDVSNTVYGGYTSYNTLKFEGSHYCRLCGVTEW